MRRSTGRAPAALLVGIAIVGSAVVGTLVACRRQATPDAPPAKLDTQEVGAAPDAALRTEGDAVEHRRVTSFSGVLPDSFPKGLPVYEPSSLIDFGSGPEGGYAVFQTPDEPAQVKARYPAMITARGWMRDGDGFARAGRRVRLTFESARPGTRLRVSY